jgi:hypothetical protein
MDSSFFLSSNMRVREDQNLTSACNLFSDSIYCFFFVFSSESEAEKKNESSESDAEFEISIPEISEVSDSEDDVSTPRQLEEQTKSSSTSIEEITSPRGSPYSLTFSHSHLYLVNIHPSSSIFHPFYTKIIKLTY